MFSVDGDFGVISSGGNTGNIPIGSDNYISLTSPVQLSFTSITWVFTFSHTFSGTTPKGASGISLAPEDFIDSDVGYKMDGKWYVQTPTGDEWLEAHAGVDGTWWQLLMLGYDRALFTNGEWTEEVPVVAGVAYQVTLSFDAESGDYTLVFSDGTGPVASGSGTATFPLLESFVGASGMVGVEVGLPDLPTVTGWTQAEQYNAAEQYDYLGNLTFPFGTASVDTKTGSIGTTCGATSWAWTIRPSWSPCGGLNATFAEARHAEHWTHWVAGQIPDGYGYLKIELGVTAETGYQAGIFPITHWVPTDGWKGRSIRMVYSKTKPESLDSGTVIGMARFSDLSTPGAATMTAYLPVADIAEGDDVWLGFQIVEKAAKVLYSCSVTEWPYQFQPGGDLKCGVASESSWTKTWVESAVVAVFPAIDVSFDEISFDGLAASDGSLIEEGDGEAMEGWNTEVVPVEDGAFSIGATPVAGTVNVFTPDGELLDYGEEWVESDDLGQNFSLLVGSYPSVTVVFFVSLPRLGTDIPVSRSSQQHVETDVPLSHLTGLL